MKKFLLGLLLLPLTMMAQNYYPYSDIALGNANGIAVVLSNASVRVCSVPTSTNPPCNTPVSNLRQLGTDGTCSLATQVNPLNADKSGNYEFCGLPGVYVAEMSKQRYGTVRVPVVISSPTGNPGGACPSGQVVVGLNPDGTLICAPESTASVTPHNLLSATHPDTTPSSPNQGDMVVGVVNSGVTKWTAVAKGNASYCWQMDSTGTFPEWAACPSSAPNQITPPPPFPVPAGQAIAWAFPSTSVYGPGDVGATNGNAYATPNYGYATMTSSGPLSNWTWGAQWQGFAMPSLPGDAVVQGIYGVIVASKISDGRGACGTTKPSLYTESTGWAGAEYNWPSGTVMGEFYTTSLGTSTATVTSMICAIQEFQTLGSSYSPPLQVTAYTVALAIYYTTATPPQNTQYVIPVPSSYNNLFGVSTAFTPLADASPISWNTSSNYVASAKVTLANTLATRAINMSGLVEGGRYMLRVTQDATGGASLTGGTGCTWLVNNVATTTIPINTSANAVQYMAIAYDGTNCMVTFPQVGGGGGGLADPGGNGIIKRTALNVTAVAGLSDISTALGYTAANDASVMHTTGAEAVGGTKTFNNGIVVPAGQTADIGGLGFNGVSTEFVETTGGTAPTVTSGCGTSPSIVGTDNAFTITGGTGTYSTCTVTFSRTWGHTPSCVANNQGSTSLTLRATPTTTTVVIDASGNYSAGGKINALCF